MSPEEARIYKDFLLKHLPNAREASGGTEINCQCIYHDDHSRHMYISIPIGDGNHSSYYCQKCQAKGIVTPSKLSEWNMYSDELADILMTNNKTVVSKVGKVDKRKTYILRNNYIKDDKLSKAKLGYINNRLGTNLTYEDCMRLKICLNLNDLLKANKITKVTRNENIVNELDVNFVGFISLDNAFVNLRRIVPEGRVYQSIDKRYVNYSIFGKTDSKERFYTIPVTIDLCQRINLHIAEGPFDILSVYLNLRNQEPGIYTCIAGNNYLGIIEHFLVTMRLFHINIHIYPDNPTKKDKSGSDDNMRKISELCAPLGIPVYIHRNTFGDEKDFGVSPDKIEENIYQLSKVGYPY